MKSLLTILLLTSLISIPSQVNAWGDEGHETIGQIAQNFLEPSIAAKVKKLLKSPGQLSGVATWADRVKFDKKSEFYGTDHLHYIDINSCPADPASMVGDYCPDGDCIVSAISKYSEQLDCASGNDDSSRGYALRFLTHFFGDITQPLHVSGDKKGGNLVKVVFDGDTHENLHKIWDVPMVQKRLADFGSDFDQYASYLTNQIQSGDYASEKDDWVSCYNSPDATTECPIAWASDSSDINCGPLVWHYRNEDLGGEYYQAAVPVIDKQIAKGGYRLGYFLNSILSKNC